MLPARRSCRLIPILEMDTEELEGTKKTKRKEKLSNLSSRLPFVGSESSFSIMLFGYPVRLVSICLAAKLFLLH